VPQATTDLAANLAATEVRRVHIRLREILAHGVQGRVKVARCNALVFEFVLVILRFAVSPRPGILSTFLLLAVFTKEILQNRAAFIAQNTGYDIASVIQSGHL
jgi:hypothetical protein